MTDTKLAELLEVAADTVDPGVAPIGAIQAKAGRARRRRRTAWVGIAAVMVVVVGAGAAAIVHDNNVDVKPMPADLTVEAPDAAVAPADMRLVGLDHAAIAVPEGWGTNETRCGTPLRSTVIINVAGHRACAVPRPAGVDSIEIRQTELDADPYIAGETIPIDGVNAQRLPTTCSQDDVFGHQVCSGAVYLPSSGVWFRVESSNAATVDALLDGVRVLPNLVGVPAYRQLQYLTDSESAASYIAALETLGLGAKVTERMTSGRPPGTVMDVDPQPGTMLELGSVVVVTISG